MRTEHGSGHLHLSPSGRENPGRLRESGSFPRGFLLDQVQHTQNVQENVSHKLNRIDGHADEAHDASM